MVVSIRRNFICVALVIALLFAVTSFEVGSVYGASEDEKDVTTWSDKQLAAQMLMFLTGSQAASKVGEFTKKGAAGLALQTPIPANLASLIAKANKKAPHHILPFIASDEEGGQVQRFRKTIYALPSANEMGKLTEKKITAVTKKYAKRLKKYKVNVVFGPVADLKVKGKFITNQSRAFASSPSNVWKKTNAWSQGFEQEGIIVTYKHWPGEGDATDTHTKSSTVPKLSILEKKDMVPFNKKFKQGCEMVMVGHVIVPKLTEKNVPASLSKKAYKYLRAKTGDDTVFITDSLSMDASTKLTGLSVDQAAVKALAGGADIALLASSNPDKTISAVAKAIKSGKIPREQAEASVGRIIQLKENHGLA
jgi:beta-N-acetylhexosaminidase